MSPTRFGSSPDRPILRRPTLRRLALGVCLGAAGAPAFGAPPDRPDGLRAEVYSSQVVELFWDRAGDDRVVIGYEIGLNGEAIGQYDALSHYIDDLVVGREYSVELVAIDADGERSSAATTRFVAGELGAGIGEAEDTGQATTPAATPDTATPGTPAGGADESAPTAGSEADGASNEPVAEGDAAPPGSAPAGPLNLRGVAYSRSSFELFWDRQSEPGLSYVVSVEGATVLRTDGTSAFLGGLDYGRDYAVQVTTIDAQGRRSAPADVTLRTGSGTTDGSVILAGRGGQPANDDSGAAAPVPAVPATPSDTAPEEPPAAAEPAAPPVETDEPAAAEPVAAEPVVPEPATPEPATPETAPAPSPATPPASDGNAFSANANDLTPDPRLYSSDGYGRADVVRIDLRTVPQEGPCSTDDESGCNLDDVLGDTDKQDELKVDIPIHFQADDFADDGTPANAEMRQRGGGARFAAQKSFRIKLDSKDVLWRQERYLQLNKHPYESSRFRNKLAFELMQDVPHLPGFLTQFVNLWIDDGNGPVDYGLYTHAERLNDDWLKRRGLPGDGNLYSAEDFRFAASDLADVAVDGDGKPLDKPRFESSIEIEEGKDHRALVAMLSAVQNTDLDFATVLERHFNRNNVLAWAAFNLLVKQDDATRHNFKLYNPAGTERFYFIPWDYDAVFGEWSEPPGDYATGSLRQRLDFGYALGHRNDFMNRYYRLPGVHAEILSAVSQMRRNALADAAIQEKSDAFYALVEPYQTRSPDSDYNPAFNSQSGRNFASKVAFNDAALRANFSIPMPPTLLAPVPSGDQLVMSWTPAYEVTGNAVTYDLEIATSPAFEADTIVVSISGISDASGTVKQGIDTDRLREGRHYARLTARAVNEPSRYWQVAKNQLTVGDEEYLGVIRFETP